MIVPRNNQIVPDAGPLDITPPEQTNSIGAGEVIGAAFRQENPIASFVSQHRAANDERDPTHNPWDQIKGTTYEPHYERFTTSWNAGQTAATMQQIDMELADRRTLEASGGWGMLASIGASILSPENLLPGGTIFRGVKTGQMAMRTAIATGTATTIGTSFAEAGLMATQELRTPEQVALNIGMSTLLGGMLGGGISALFSRVDFARLAKGMEDEALAATDGDSLAANERAVLSSLNPSSAGAAARPVATLDENSIAGRAASAVGAATAQLNPVLRALHSPSPVMREVATKLFENPLYLRRHMTGDTAGPAVESLVKQYNQGAMASGIEQANAIYSDFRKAGGQLNRSEFNQAVGRAMRRGDQDANPLVGKAAALWRSTVFDPLKDAAITAKLLPEDVSVETAASYFSRVYNRPKIEAREPEFKAIVRRYIAQEVKNAEIRLEVSRIDPRYDAPTKPTPEFLTDADRASYVDEIVNDVFNTLTGRNVDGDMPLNIVASKRGPLKERTFSIPDHMIEDFLEHDVEAVARRYSRVMAADVELTTMFGKADMSAQIAEIKQNYQQLRETVSAGQTGGKAMTPAQIEAALKRLAANEKSDLRDLMALRDMIRGSYLARENSTNFARVARVAGQINYIRALGGVTLSSLADIARLPMVHGLDGVMRDGLVPLIRNLKGFKMAVGEAKLAGAVTERILNTRMATFAELADPYSSASPFERFMENTANQFSKATGLLHWNDATKSLASVMTQNRVLRGAGNYAGLGKRERAYLAYLGIDGSMAERIAKQFELHGSVEDGGVRVAGSADWSDDYAQRVYRAAIAKDIDATIITKGVGDTPLWFSTPTGRLISQFKSFAVASHQRALMRGLQERPMGFVTGTMFATTMGMLVYYLKSVEANRMEDISDNPGRWIAEGLDRSGMFSIAFEVNNTIEKAFGIGAYGALAAAFPGGDQDGKASRYAMRSTAAALTGPTGDLIDTAIRAAQAIKGSGDGLSEGDINSIKRLLPGATLPVIRSFVEYFGQPAVEQAVGVE